MPTTSDHVNAVWSVVQSCIPSMLGMHACGQSTSASLGKAHSDMYVGHTEIRGHKLYVYYTDKVLNKGEQKFTLDRSEY